MKAKKPARRADAVKNDPWDGTLWKVRVRVDGRHVFPYAGPGVARADALSLARSMVHPAYVVCFYRAREAA